MSRKPISLVLKQEQKEELAFVRDHDARSYVRERAAALLKIASGQSGLQVATLGLLKPRDPDTIYAWVERYRTQGFAGLTICCGRGRKPAFSPQCPDQATAKAALLDVIGRDPQTLGYCQSRWSLQAIADCCEWLRVTTKAGLSQLLERLGISYKRGRDYVHSPDRFYQHKCAQIKLALLRAWYDLQRYVLLYVDEFGVYRQPTLAQDWDAMGSSQPLARRSHKSNTCYRGIGALNPLSGQLTYLLRSEISVSVLAKFYGMIRADYPAIEQIYVVEDNWPVHFHPTLLAQLQAQELAYPPRLPRSWSNLKMPKRSSDPLPITLLNLPTYAPWLNPIEKLWRWLKQTVIHLHSLSDDWQTLKQRVHDFLELFRHGSTDLLRYVGLLPN